MKKLFYTSLVLVALAAGASADSFIKQVTSTDPFEVGGRKMPGKSDTSTIWLAKDMATMIGGSTGTVIVRVDKRTIYLVNPANKSFAEIPMEWYSQMSKQMDSLLPDSNAQMKSIKDMATKLMGSTKVNVVETNEARKFKTWNAKKYNVTISTAQGATTSEVWASTDIKVDLELYRTLSNAFLSQVPGFQNIMKEMRKVQGMAVYSVREMGAMGTKIKSTTELMECADKPAPAGIFDLPAGYSKVKIEDLKLGR